MKEIDPKNIDENPTMIVIGILVFYFLVVFFAWYLMFLHRITPIVGWLSILIFSGVYSPRFMILKNLAAKDIIQITDEEIVVNNRRILLSEIEDYRVEEKNPQVVFFMNSKMIVFYEAFFCLKIRSGEVQFNTIGSEKIKLLKAFLEELLRGKM